MMKIAGSLLFSAILVAIAVQPSFAAPHIAAEPVAVAHRSDLRDLGRVGGSQTVRLSIVMRYRNEAQLDRLIDAVSDPSSPIYRHFLTNQQFNDAFAPSIADQRRVGAALARAGFAVSATPNGTIINAVGPASAAERYFHTEIHAVQQAGAAGVRYANVTPAFVPLEISAVVRDIVGLDSLRGPTTDHFLARGVTPDKLGGTTHGPHGGYSPFAIAQAYDYPVQHGFGGHGHAIGIAIDYDSSDTDLAAFTAYFGIKRTGKDFHVPVDGGQPYDPNGGSVESTLDTETVASLDPGADMYVYNFGAAFTWQEITDAYNKAVSDDLVDAVSSSFGLCEDDVATSIIDTIQSITKQGAVKGVSFVASTGDFGRGGKCSDGTGQDVPAVTHFFTSVGGVDPSIDSNGNLISQREDSGSGGGSSDIFPLPHYQIGVVGIYSTTKRNIPDVSGPYFPDAFYYAGSWGVIGGTSWAAPATAAYLVEVNQVEGSRTGFANPTLYENFENHGYAVYTDIVTGNNGIACAVGYDDCSGIGSILGLALARKI